MSVPSSIPFAIATKAERFCHEDAKAISKWVLSRHTAKTVVIDLSRANDATTAAFATLVVLRKKLLQNGRDLRVSGLRDRAENVFNVNRLQTILPLN
jgi:anti-anti-sigma regulatory factor